MLSVPPKRTAKGKSLSCPSEHLRQGSSQQLSLLTMLTEESSEGVYREALVPLGLWQEWFQSSRFTSPPTSPPVGQ